MDNLLVINNISDKITFVYDTKKSNPIQTVGSPQPIPLVENQNEKISSEERKVEEPAKQEPSEENNIVSENAVSDNTASDTQANTEVTEGTALESTNLQESSPTTEVKENTEEAIKESSEPNGKIEDKSLEFPITTNPICKHLLRDI